MISDNRVDATARAERDAADALPANSPEKAAALVSMKKAEQAARNTPGGYWIAASDPGAVDHALTGAMPISSVRRTAVLSDGATRAVDPFGLHDWRTLLDLVSVRGPVAVLDAVRAAEAADPDGTRWPRNKLSHDATVAYCTGFPSSG